MLESRLSMMLTLWSICVHPLKTTLPMITILTNRVAMVLALEAVLAAATPYLKQFGNVAGGYYLARGALAAAGAIRDGSSDKAYLESKIAIANFYAGNYLSESEALTTAVTAGADVLSKIDPAVLSQ